MKKNLSYMDSVHRDGTIWNLSVMVLLFAFPVAVAIFFDVMPDWAALGAGLIATAPMYWAVGIIETFTFVPMLGAGGSYLSFVTGNISNLKLPCALNALEQNGVSANSEEGEVISTIAIAVSSIVTTLIIIVGVVCIVPLTPVLEAPILEPAFAQMLRAARSQFDYILIDAPAGIDEGFRLAAKFVDRVLLVTGPDPGAIRDAGRAGELLELMGKTDVRLVVNRVNRKIFSTMSVTIDDVMDNAGLPLVGIVPEDPSVTLAASFGHPLFYFAPRCPAAKAFRRIGRRVQGFHQRIALK